MNKEWYDKPWREPEEPGALDELKDYFRERAVNSSGFEYDPFATSEIAVVSKVKVCPSCFYNSAEGMEIPCSKTKQRKAGNFNCCPEWKGVVVR